MSTNEATGSVRITRRNSDIEEVFSVWGPLALTTAFEDMSWPDSDVTVSSDDPVYDEEYLVMCLPQVTGAQDDVGYELVDLPLDDNSSVLAHATVNGHTWAFVSTKYASLWVPAPYWDHPEVKTVYEMYWTTEGGAEHLARLHCGAGVVVEITNESHFNARVDGIEEVSIWGGEAEFKVDDLPIPEDDPDDPLSTLEIEAPSLDETASRELAERLVLRFSEDAEVSVNGISAVRGPVPWLHAVNPPKGERAVINLDADPDNANWLRIVAALRKAESGEAPDSDD